jgi:hypothetical protein
MEAKELASNGERSRPENNPSETSDRRPIAIDC